MVCSKKRSIRPSSPNSPRWAAWASISPFSLAPPPRRRVRTPTLISDRVKTCLRERFCARGGGFIVGQDSDLHPAFPASPASKYHGTEVNLHLWRPPPGCPLTSALVRKMSHGILCRARRKTANHLLLRVEQPFTALHHREHVSIQSLRSWASFDFCMSMSETRQPLTLAETR